MPRKTNQELAPIESHAIAVIEPLEINQILERTKVVAQVMEKVMHPDIHYGVIPGCKKPSLYKAGAEKIAVTFQLAIDTEIEDLSQGDEVRYRVHAIARNLGGQFLGSAFGECSSYEEKYKWRKCSVQEYEEADEDRRRIKVFRNYTNNQIRTQPADLANTILQMADKRAYVAVVRKVTAASDVFTQDVEDLDKELVSELEGEPPEDLQPTSKSEGKKTGDKPKSSKSGKSSAPVNTNPITEGPLKLVRVKLEQHALTEQDLCKKFGLDKIEDLTMDKVNDVFEWMKNPG